MNNILYPHPPLVEAICEVRFQLGDWDLSVPGRLYELLKESYPVRRQSKGVTLSVKLGPDTAEQQVGVEDRLQLRRRDDSALVQVGPHFLSVNHFRPYPGWATFQHMIGEALAAYREVTDTPGLRRTSLRYVNHIHMQGQSIELKDHLDFYPYLGDRLPKSIISFHIAAVSEFRDANDLLRIRLEPAPSESPEVKTAVLDLEYFTARPGSVDFGDIDTWLRHAHEVVSNTFEGCIRDTLRAQFRDGDHS